MPPTSKDTPVRIKLPNVIEYLANQVTEDYCNSLLEWRFRLLLFHYILPKRFLLNFVIEFSEKFCLEIRTQFMRR